jgi:hypothetical protein
LSVKETNRISLASPPAFPIIFIFSGLDAFDACRAHHYAAYGALTSITTSHLSITPTIMPHSGLDALTPAVMVHSLPLPPLNNIHHYATPFLYSGLDAPDACGAHHYAAYGALTATQRRTRNQ